MFHYKNVMKHFSVELRPPNHQNSKLQGWEVKILEVAY